MAKAFLSHSTDDKPYVLEVAQRLGRAKAHIDLLSFEPGEDFRAGIRRTLDDSDVFVLFVSPSSLASSWVQFEIDEAELRALRGVLRRSIAIFIDGPVDASQLPSWLARVRAVQHTSPGQSARTIEALLLGRTADEQRPFVGRHDDLQRAIRKLSNTDPEPRVLAVSGLAGVGRRSFARRVFGDAFSLNLGPTIELSSTATLEDLFIESHLSATMLTLDDAERQINAFRSLTRREQSTEVAQQLAFLAREGTAPCIVDHGAMLDSSGRYLDDYADLLSDFIDEPGVYLCVLHRRAPDLRDLATRPRILERKLRPLEPPDAQTLVSRLLREAQVPASVDQQAQLAEATGGYPPAAYYVVAQVEDYGIDVVLGDPSRTTDIYTRNFSRFIRDLELPPIEREILVYLSSESRLALAGIAAATGTSLEKTAIALGSLVDLSLVEPVDDEYAVAAPIQTTVLRTEDGLGRRWYEAAFKRLEEEYWADEHSLPPISVVDATLRAGFRIGRSHGHGYGSLVRPSLLINAAQEMYHRQDYTGALEYLDRAESLGGRTPQLLEVRVRSLAQLRRFGEARSALRDYRESGDRRQWYLDGFIERKARNHAEACSRFQRGYSRGDRSVSLLRDYADSLLRTDALQDAAEMVAEALEREPGNIYVLDLAARIAIAGGTREEAEAALSELETADVDERLILQRRASYLLYRQGNAEAVKRAVGLAEKATARRDAPLDAFLVLARALIRTRDWDKLADTKRQIEKRQRGSSRQGGARPYIRQLDLEAALERGDWRRAEKLLPNDDRTIDERYTRAAVLDLKSVDRAVLLSERQEAEARAKALRKDIPEQRPPSDEELYE